MDYLNYETGKRLRPAHRIARGRAAHIYSRGQRQGLEFEEARGTGTNIRFDNISTATKKSPWDEEQGIKVDSHPQQNAGEVQGPKTAPGSNRRLFEILSTKRGNEDRGTDVVTLITKDGVKSRAEKAVETNQRWM